ncbi:hypothetical protein Rhe02_77600 [Rhizocola hellebori]|uniref:ASCH domain-containing protein n=1 Tax=Rhizocola hellebori TaxID=1392758 RepID=A0A8J3QF21_9ACTN|nr:ASCH domain-containing protein [Rhizocola hellebori]GIH09693.1 hypothetical protein Rhe02_77600 [Rhizocola hellebori]
MLIPMPTLTAIAAGEVTLAFRRWDRARVKAGTQLRTAIGLVEVTSVESVKLSSVTAGQAKLAGFGSRQALHDFLNRKPQGTIFRIELRPAGADPRIALRADDDLSDVEIAAIVDRLAAMDRSSGKDPWTSRFLRLIAERPAVRAPDLAESVGWETLVFKRYVRRLKELGLTESLDIGYRLSPRGQVVLSAILQGGRSG